jgi:putative ABC transport system substrate-binding protein
VRLKVDIIVTHSAEPVLAAKRATSSVPIVFGAAADPVGSGLVASLARPGGNVTGLSVQFTDLAGKRLELLREIVPHLRRLAIMANVSAPGAIIEMREVQTVAVTHGLRAVTSEVRQVDDIAPAFEALRHTADALYVSSDPLLNTSRFQISALAISARLPTTHGFREHADAGGLMSYGANHPAMFRRAADFVDKILKGAKPADLPVEQPTKFELVINLKTAKALGLTIAPTLLARADEVIE